jgi:hypothetical protein
MVDWYAKPYRSAICGYVQHCVRSVVSSRPLTPRAEPSLKNGLVHRDVHWTGSFLFFDRSCHVVFSDGTPPMSRY